MVEAFLEYDGFEADRDDILDALVAAVCALEIDSCRTLPEQPETDSTGLAMEMVYFPAGALYGYGSREELTSMGVKRK